MFKLVKIVATCIKPVEGKDRCGFRYEMYLCSDIIIHSNIVSIITEFVEHIKDTEHDVWLIQFV